MEEFKPLELCDRETVMGWLEDHPPEVSEHTFVNLYVWRYRHPVRWAELMDSLVLVSVTARGQRRLLGPPRGETGVAQMLEELSAAGVVGFDRVPEKAAEALREAGLHVREDRDNSDYVYRREDLAELEGRRYHRQRNLVNQCLGRYECEYCEVTEGLLEEVAEMAERWFGERELEQSPGLAEEYWALREALENFAAFQLVGGAVRVDGRIEAFSLGGRLSPGVAVVHFEKAMAEFKGLYQVINQWFCREGLGDFEFVNREQDLGIPGLRKAKKSYHPDHMVDKYVATWTEEG